MDQNGKEYQKAIEYIRSLIIDQKIQIGSRIPPERKISETLSISRNSTREALRMLENMGLIESRQGLGNYLSGNVSQSLSKMIDAMLILQQTDAEDIFQFRRGIEKTVFDLAYKKRKNNPYLAQMKPLFPKFPKAMLAAQIEMDKEFHYLLIRAAGNKLLSIMMSSVSDIYYEGIDLVLRNASPEVMHNLHLAHLAIYEGLVQDNPASGIQAIDRHYDIIDKMSFQKYQIGNFYTAHTNESTLYTYKVGCAD
ncbi:MAG: GntR family transcriptional regulator [Veillonellales bacterium]